MVASTREQHVPPRVLVVVLSSSMQRPNKVDDRGHPCLTLIVLVICMVQLGPIRTRPVTLLQRATIAQITSWSYPSSYSCLMRCARGTVSNALRKSTKRQYTMSHVHGLLNNVSEGKDVVMCRVFYPKTSLPDALSPRVSALALTSSSRTAAQILDIPIMMVLQFPGSMGSLAFWISAMVFRVQVLGNSQMTASLNSFARTGARVLMAQAMNSVHRPSRSLARLL